MSWLMSSAQQALYWRLWGVACREQGWDKWPAKDRDARRKLEHEKVFGGPKSAKDIERRGEFDRIKNHWLFLGGDVAGTVEMDRPDLGQGRRWRQLVEVDQVRLLRALGIEPGAYLGAILRDMFRGRGVDELSAVAGPGGRAELERLMMTIAGRIDAKRREFGWSVHKLYSAADLRCPCICRLCRVSRLDNEPF